MKKATVKSIDESLWFGDMLYLLQNKEMPKSFYKKFKDKVDWEGDGIGLVQLEDILEYQRAPIAFLKKAIDDNNGERKEMIITMVSYYQIIPLGMIKKYKDTLSLAAIYGRSNKKFRKKLVSAGLVNPADKDFLEEASIYECFFN